MSDILPDRFVPPLSATSDMPDFPAPTPEPVKAEPAVAEAVEEAPETETAPESGGSEAASGSEGIVEEAQDGDVEAASPEVKEKEPRGVGKALEAQRKAIEAERARAELAERRAAELMARIEAAQARVEPPAPPPEEKPEPAPERTNFEDPNDFYKALGEWSGKQATRAAKAELAAEAAIAKAVADKAAEDARNQVELQKQVTVWNERKAKALEKMPDYAEVAEADGLAISQTMANVILRSENGPEVAYHLGKNPDEAKRIWALAPIDQVYEIGALAAKLSAPKPNVSRAPDPIKPIRQSSAPANRKSPAEMDMNEYANHRMAQLRAGRSLH